MKDLSHTAMVLAAGFGKRLQPLTLKTPKPLLTVGGRSMLDLAIDKLVAFGIQRVVVNCFYLKDQIIAHCSARKDVEIIISEEEALLDTGGGVKKALGFFEGKPFFTLNSDLPWIDGDVPALQRLSEKWNAARMDSLLLLMETAKARGFGTDGDFFMNKYGVVWRKGMLPPRPYVWIGAQIVKPELYEKQAEQVFSNNAVWNQAEDAGHLYGVGHDGTCFHSGTERDLAEANRLLADGSGWG